MPIRPNSELSREVEPFVDAAEAARHLGITRRELLVKTRTGILPGHPVDPNLKRKTWRYKVSEIDTAISGNVVRKPPASDNRHGSPRKPERMT